MARTKHNAEREHRIEMEVVVDAYSEDERAVSWYYYLEEQLSFPFEANQLNHPLATRRIWRSNTTESCASIV